MNETARTHFVETLEYRRFREFCDDCRRDKYIGLCYGPPGVGKTLSALYYAQETISTVHQAEYAREGRILKAVITSNVVNYTAKVLNSPGQIEKDIQLLRQSLHYALLEQLRRERDERLALVRDEEEKKRRAFLASGISPNVPLELYCKTDPSFGKVVDEYDKKCKATKDPTSLIIIDEADRLKMAALEQVRDMFDRRGVGVVLIGMPGLHKQLARYPRLSSRVGFVHEFRPLNEGEIRRLFGMGWKPGCILLPREFDFHVISAIVRVTGGNFRLIDRLLTQISRILEINELPDVTAEVVEAARESLVIGVT